MASLGELFYEAGVKLSGMNNIDELEKRLKSISEKTTVTIEISGVDLVNQYNKSLKATITETDALTDKNATLSKVIEEVYSKHGDRYKKLSSGAKVAGEEIEKLTQKQINLISLINSADQGGQNRNVFETRAKAIKTSADKYVSEYRAVAKTIEDIANQVFGDDPGKNRANSRYNALLSQATTIRSVANELESFSSKYNQLVKEAGSTSAISSQAKALRGEFAATLQDSMKQVMGYEKQLSSFFEKAESKGVQIPEALKAAFKEVQLSIGRNSDGFNLKQLEIEKVWVKEFAPAEGSIIALRKAIQAGLDNQSFSVNITGGATHATKGGSTPPAPDTTPYERYVAFRQQNAKEFLDVIQKQEAVWKGMAEKDKNGIPKGIVPNYDEKIQELKNLIQIEKREREERLKGVDLDKTIANARVAMIDKIKPNYSGNVADLEKMSIEELTTLLNKQNAALKDNSQAHQQQGAAAQEAAQGLAKEGEAAEVATRNIDNLSKKMSLALRKGELSELGEKSLKSFDAAAFSGGKVSSVEVVNTAIKNLTGRLEQARIAFDALSESETENRLKKRLLDANAEIIKTKQYLDDLSKSLANGDVTQGAVQKTIKDAEILYSRLQQVYELYDKKRSDATAALSLSPQVYSAQAEEKAILAVGDSAELTVKKIQAMKEALSWDTPFGKLQDTSKLMPDLGKQINEQLTLFDKGLKDGSLSVARGAENELFSKLSDVITVIDTIKAELAAASKDPKMASFSSVFDELSKKAEAVSAKTDLAWDAIGFNNTDSAREHLKSLGDEMNLVIGIFQRFKDVLGAEGMFSKGIIDLRGPGTSTSDSIKALLSVGESVMSADTTKMFKAYLNLFQAMNGGSHDVEQVRLALEKLNNLSPNKAFTIALEHLRANSKLAESDITKIEKLLNDASKPFMRENPRLSASLAGNGDYFASRYTRPGYDDMAFVKGQSELREQIRQEQELARAAEMTARQLEARQRAMALGQLSGRHIFSGIIDTTAEQGQLQMIGNAIEYLKQKIMANPERSFFEDVAKEINRLDVEISNSITNINAYKDILKNQNLANSPVALEASDKLKEEERLYNKLIADRREYADLIAPGKSKNLDEMNTLYGRIDNMKAVYDDLAAQIQKVNELNTGTERRIADLGTEKDAIMALAQAWDNLIAANKVYDVNGNFTPEALNILDQYKQRVDNIKASTQTLSEAEKQRVKQEQESVKEQEKNQKSLDKLHEKYGKLSDTLSKLKNQRDIDVQNGLKTDRIDNVIAHYERLLRVLRDIMSGGNIDKVNKALSKIGSISGTGNTIAGNAKAWDHQTNIALTYKRAIEGATTSAVEHNNALKDTLSQTFSLQNQFQQLGMTIQNTFSILGIQQFAKEIISIGGEIEKQKLAMGSILGGQDKANKIYGQLSQLSMISPFSVEDVMKYSKQLSAFGIEYDELYDTTRRLADIAAGVGVDFGRIAYEYGQTSSRGWLDARELRMFANSGIPLLQKLADHYSKLRDEMVSTTQVREMISKREVSFEDVKSVLWGMTDEGGTFFKMQEVMADSLAAKYANLKNAWNLMLADLAQGGIGDALKSLATALTKLTQSWGDLMPQVAAFTGTLVTYKTITALSAKAVTDETASLIANAAANKKVATEEYIRLLTRRGLTEEEIKALAVERELTAADLQRMFASGKLSEKQTKLAIQNGVLGESYKKLNRQQKINLLTTAGFSKSFAVSATSANIFTRALVGLRVVATGLWTTLQSMLPVAALFAVVAGITAIVNALRKRGELQRELNKIDKEAREEQDKTINSLKYYQKQLDNTNLSMEERLKIIEKLKSEYGEYLGDLNEEADAQKRISEAIGSVNKNARTKRKMDQIEKVRSYYGEKMDSQSESVKKRLDKQYKDNPALAADIYAEFLRMADEGYNIKEIKDSLKKIEGVNAIPSDAIADYISLRDARNRKIAKIEGDNSDLTKAEQYMNRIDEYWNDINSRTSDYSEKLQNSKAAYESMIKLLTTKKTDKVDIFSGTRTESVAGFGDLYDEHSPLVQEIQGKLDKINDIIEQGWRTIANTTLEGVEDTAVVESLKPNDKITDLEYFKELAKKSKETKEQLEKLEKLKVDQTGKIDDNGIALWGEAQEKRLERTRKTDEMLDQLEKALGLNYEDFESKSSSKQSQEMMRNIQNLKKAYEEYKKFAALYGPEEGLKQWTKTDRYKREFADVSIPDIMEYRNALIRAYNEASSDPKLKEAASQISDILIQFDMDFSEKSVTQAVSKLKNKLSEDSRRFDFFKTLVDAGVNKELAYKVALDGIGKGMSDSVAESIKAGARRSIKDLVGAFKVATGTFETEVQEVARIVPKTRKDFLLKARAGFISALSTRSFVPKQDIEAFANIMTAQLADESRYGESGLSVKYNNFGGHKVGVKGNHVIGKSGILNNKAGNDAARYNIYDSLEGFIEDQVDYINRRYNAFSDGVDKYFWHLQDEMYGKRMYATVDLPPAPGKPYHGKGYYEKTIKGKYLQDVLAAVAAGGSPEYARRFVKTTVTHMSDTSVSSAEIEKIFSMSESEIRAAYGDYADRIIDIVESTAERIQSEVSDLRFENAGDYFKANIEQMLGATGINIEDMRYLDAEGLQDYAKDNGFKNLSKIQSQQLQGYTEEYFKYVENKKNETQNIFVEALKEAQAYTIGLSEAEVERQKRIDAVNELMEDGEEKTKILIGIEALYQKKLIETSYRYQAFMGNVYALTLKEAQAVGDELKKNLDDRLKSGTISAQEYADEMQKISERLFEIKNRAGAFQTTFTKGLNGLVDYRKQQANAQMSQAAEMIRKGDTERGEALREGAMQMMEGAQEFEGVVAVIDMIVHGIDNFVQGIKGTVDEIVEMRDALGYDTSANSKSGRRQAFWDTFSKASSNAASGWDSLKNGDLGGVIKGVVGSWTSWWTGAAQAFDARLDEQIQESKTRMEQFKSVIDSASDSFENLGQSASLSLSRARNKYTQLERQMSGLGSKLTDSQKRAFGLAGGNDSALWNYLGDDLAYSEKRASHYAERAGITFGKAFVDNTKATVAGSAAGFAAGGLGGAIIGGLAGSALTIKDLINSFGSKRASRELQKYTGYIYAAVEAFEALERAGINTTSLGNATDLGKQYISQYEGLIYQRLELEKQLAAEEAKKKTDKDAVADYQEQLAGINDEIRDFVVNMYKELYDLDMTTWASQIGDALVEAFSKGEDALSAFNNSVNEMLASIGKRVISQYLQQMWIDPLMKQIFGEDGMGGIVGLQSGNPQEDAKKLIAFLAQWRDANGEDITNFVEEMYEGLDEEGGIFSQRNTSGLTNSIQGVTADQADILGAYINGMRGDVSVERELFEQLMYEQLPLFNATAESQLTQLEMITENTRLSAEYAAICADYAEQTYTLLSDVSNNNKKFYIN